MNNTNMNINMSNTNLNMNNITNNGLISKDLSFISANNNNDINNSKLQNMSFQVYKKIYAQTNVADPRYVDCEEIALTKDKGVTTSDILTVDGTSYAVKYIIPSPKYSTLLLQRKT